MSLSRLFLHCWSLALLCGTASLAHAEPLAFVQQLLLVGRDPADIECPGQDRHVAVHPGPGGMFLVQQSVIWLALGLSVAGCTLLVIALWRY